MASASVCRSHVLHVQPHIPLYSTNGGARDFSVAKSFRTRALSSCPSSIPLICKRTKKIFKEEAHSWRNDGNPRRFAGKQGQLERPPLHWQQHSRSKWAPFRCNAAHVEVAANTGLDKQGGAQRIQKLQSVSELQEQFCCPGIEFQDVTGLRVASLKLAEGSSVRIVLEGARVITWKAVMYHKGKEDLIYSKLNRTRDEGSGLLRGGIPISFPEAAGGVAGNESRGGSDLANLVKWMPWRVVSTWSDGDAFAEIVMSCEDTPESRAVWNHHFKLRYSVHQMPDRLVLVFRCQNTDSRPFSFAASLDSHLAVVDSGGAHVTGLEGAKCSVRNKRNRSWQAKGMERQQEVALGRSMERFYCKPKFDISLFDRGGYRTLNLVKEGFQDVLLVDIGASAQDTFVCLGSGTYNKITLLPGESWEGRQTIQLGA